MIIKILLVAAGFAGMEFLSYLVHRFLFHGILWRIHQTHHKSNKLFLELNDIFSIVFALISIGSMISVNALAFPIGLGIAIYGFVYFITHDFFTHRRFLTFNSKNKFLLTIRAAHQRHHQSIEKQGLEPYGLFIFDYKTFARKTFQSEK